MALNFVRRRSESRGCCARRGNSPATIRGRNWPRAPQRALLRYLSRIPREVSTPPPTSPSPPASLAIRIRRAITTRASTASPARGGNEGRARLRPLPRQRPRASAAQIAGVPRRRLRHLRHVPDEVLEQYRASVHGQALQRGVAQAPLCTDCHGEHNISKHANADSPVNAAHVRDNCGSCHGDVRLNRKFGLPSDRLVSYDASFHGLAAKSGSQTVANCASCHGVHNILASSDPKSTINAKNLPETCGQMPRRRSGPVLPSVRYTSPRAAPSRPLRFTREFYPILIPVTIGLMICIMAATGCASSCARASPGFPRRNARRPRPWRHPHVAL